MAESQKNPAGAANVAVVPAGSEEDVRKAAEVCPSECSYGEA